MPITPLADFLTYFWSNLVPALFLQVRPRTRAAARLGEPVTALIRARLTEILSILRKVVASPHRR